MPENSTLDLTTLNAASKCFNCWSSTEKKAATLWLMAKALNAIVEEADHDFTNVNTFQEVIRCFRCVPKPTLESFLLATFRQLAINAGAIGELSASEIRSEAQYWFCLDPVSLDAGFAFMLNEIISDTSGGADDD